MTGFDADWLAQREPLDLAARDRSLEQRFVAALRAASPVRLLDLAGGTAANFRALAPRLAVDQDWVLADQDAGLLAAAFERIERWARAQGWSTRVAAQSCEVRTGSACWSLRTRQLDLAAALESIDADAFDGIVTTAFLDLVSSDWLARLARWLQAAQRPLLATLTVDGDRTWMPDTRDDPLIAEAFRRHQSGDKGFGPSVGSAATAVLADALRAAGFAVSIARSDWHIGPAQGALLQRLCDEAAQVAREVAPDALGRIDAWRAARAAGILADQVGLRVGHLDLLALASAETTRR